MQAYTIEIKKSHGRVVVMAKGRTGRGTSFIKDTRMLNAESIRAPEFKAEMVSAVESMLGSAAVDIQFGLDIDNKGG